MIYAILGLVGTNAFCIFLIIRTQIANGKLRNEKNLLEEVVQVQKEQLRIASRPPATPDELTRRMRENQL